MIIAGIFRVATAAAAGVCAAAGTLFLYRGEYGWAALAAGWAAFGLRFALGRHGA